ncbi:hypothetical protein GJR98_08535 [Haloferax sp. MBLA0077]|uniref:Blue (type 1) copper domain-containing protein n=3 Tax=Haloferacaceae TaxID=1644056 RepID=A0A6G1Z2I6_9EURY|nr:hypothetical protein Hfx1149_08560 [Haloferax sp. CBA1149]MRW80756.1 hypothetical protein [Haloferax marinisediminis]
MGTAVAQSDENGEDDSTPDNGNSGGGPEPNELDPIFGYASAEPNPCSGESGEDCFEAFKQPVRPAHEVELHIDLPEELFAFTAPGVLDEDTIAEINAAAADGVVEAGELSDPTAEVTAPTPEGDVTLTVEELATLLAESTAFHYEPTGLTVEPGDVVIYSAETPDHGVSAYHERHGRQNRVPEGVGPISSPLVPVGGYWLYKFETPGVYDFYCPPHQIFGMVSRVVVTDGDVPELSIEETGRPPEEMNVLPLFLQGLDPNLPSEAAVFETEALTPENIVSEGRVSWETVVEEYRGGA